MIHELPSLSNTFHRTHFELSDKYNTLLDVRLVGDDVDVDGHEEAEGSVAERDGRKKFRIFGRRANDPTRVAQHHLEPSADVLKKQNNLACHPI